MKTDAEADGQPIWATSNDERTTTVGKLIRNLRIDRNLMTLKTRPLRPTRSCL